MKPTYFIPFLLLACNAGPTPEPHPIPSCEYVTNVFMTVPPMPKNTSWFDQENSPDSGTILRRFNMVTNEMRILMILSPHLLSSSNFNERFKVVQRWKCSMRELTWETVELSATVPIKSTGG